MHFKNAFWILFISMIPLIELRGAIPVGAVLEVPFYINYVCAVIGNLLPVPFILLLIPKVLDFMYRFKRLRPIVDWLRKKADKNAGKITGDAGSIELTEKLSSADRETDSADYTPSSAESDACGTPTLKAPSLRKTMPTGAFVGLMLFVLIPMPGTGAWTGSLVASLFGFPKMKSFISVMLGVLGCGVIMCLASYGVLGFLSFLL